MNDNKDDMMDFSEKIAAHSRRVLELRDQISTEEATKTSLILPFFSILGYDVFDPRVVVPEYTADVGTKKGERVDYAIKREGEIIMLVEAKAVGDALDAGKAAQLRRYFNSLPTAKLGILTDGVRYKFFSDLDAPNIMDDKPFMIFDFAVVDKILVEEIRKLRNDGFDIEVALDAALEMKYLRELKAEVERELAKPSDELVKLLAKRVHSGALYPNIMEEFRDRVRRAFEHHINDVLNSRLQLAMQPNASPVKSMDAKPGADTAGPAAAMPEIVTTEAEIEAYHIVKALLRENVAPDRIGIRDTLSYCNVLLDDKKTKPICRFYFDAQSAKYLELIGDDGKWVKHKIDSLNDIYGFEDTLKATAARYE